MRIRARGGKFWRRKNPRGAPGVARAEDPEDSRGRREKGVPPLSGCNAEPDIHPESTSTQHSVKGRTKNRRNHCAINNENRPSRTNTQPQLQRHIRG